MKLSSRARHAARLPLMGMVLVLSGACTIIPDEGPSVGRIERDSKADAQHATYPFSLIDLNASTAEAVGRSGSGVRADMQETLEPGPRLGSIGPGDMLHVTLWEPNQAGTGLLDHPSLDLNSRVEADGTISVPYAGRLHVAGRSPADVELVIQRALTSQVVAPQVSVLVVEDQTNDVIIEGDVVHAGRVPLTQSARHLLDVLAIAGGTRDPDYRTVLQVSRGRRTKRLALSDLLREPALNILLAPGDRVLVSLSDRYFYAFGAVNRPGQQPYEGTAMTLGESLGRIAGLQDQRANPAGVFLFRRQDPILTEELLGHGAPTREALRQVVYRINFRDPTSFFVMNNFNVRPGDVIYVTNAPLAELSKFALILSGIGTTGAIRGNFTN